MNRAILVILGVMAALVVGVGVLVVILVATGGDDDGTTQTQETPADDGGSEGELRLIGPEPITLDPHTIQDAASAIYVVEIFGGLLTLDTDLAIQPDLAAEIPTEANGGKVVNADGTVTYTFHLLEGLLFHDRKPVFAETVKASFERAADPLTQSLVSEFFLGDIVGVTEKLRGQANEISGIEVIDETTLTITIEADLPSFLFKLTYPTAFVIDPTQVENDPNWTRRPNGTGPYKLEQWRFGERIVLEANERYHLGAPNIKTVRYLLAGSSITLYEAGDIDVAGVALDDLERIQDPADALNAEYRRGNRLSLDYLGFNTNTPPFDDPLVRKAFAMAIDKEQIARAVYQDAIPVANSILMPGLAAYSETAQPPQFDVEAAIELLNQSSYGGADGLPEITLAESGTGATSGPGTSAILEMWRVNLGVDVQIQQAEAATFFQDVDQGRYQLFTLGWIMDYPDEDDILNIHFDSDSPNNNTGYSNPDVDALLRAALTEPDPQTRINLYREAEEIILDEVPWFPLFFDQFHALVKPYVNNYLIPASIVPRLRFISLDE
ncbi:MAG: peptide ABC transporter substrate-binding protein [Chloroflexi bacterium]|nr:peptide ABC transporter substrate-binding protein [Chloroflexota bacterium]MCI0855795.1 peptide ABC transporter substrate-binding protein [Chloroflexota bacterium]MCI0889744.1 peptide ABC transporter substrate-binding protein [Chloroflexota bacterium]